MTPSTTQLPSLYKILLRGLAYTALILIGATLLANIAFALSGNDDIGSWFFFCSILGGVTFVLTSELLKLEARLEQHRQREASPLPDASQTLLPSGREQAVSSAVDHRTVIEFACPLFLFSLHVRRDHSQIGVARVRSQGSSSSSTMPE